MKKIVAGILAVVMGVMMAGAPVMAADQSTGEDNSANTTTTTTTTEENCVPTAILGSNGQSCDDGNGSGIADILSLVVEIMTIGIGILGVAGITISGLQYLTAGSSEEKTRKAKQRLFEIVLGLVVYVILFALLEWLIPDFHPFS